jgi:superfamily II DNA or RNA helicase
MSGRALRYHQQSLERLSRTRARDLDQEPRVRYDEVTSHQNVLDVPMRIDPARSTAFRDAFVRSCHHIADAGAIEGMAKPLHDHQCAALRALATELNKPSARGVSVSHYFGAGKTVLAGALLGASQKAKKAVGWNVPDVLVTSERAIAVDIARQLQELGLAFELLSGGRNSDATDIHVRLTAGLSVAAKKLERCYPEGLGLLVVDEADLCTAQSHRAAIGSLAPVLRVGLSATERVVHGPHISRIFGPIVHRLEPAQALLNGGAVCPLLYLYSLDFRLENIPGDADYNPELLGRAMTRAGVVQAVLEIYGELVPTAQRPEFPTLIYLPTKSLVQQVSMALSALYAGESISVKGWWSGAITRKRLLTEIEAFNAGEIDVLCLCGMGGRGVNFPRARLEINASPSRSARIGHQLFRVLRTLPEEIAATGFTKPYSLVAQIVPEHGPRSTLLTDVVAGELFTPVPRKPGLLAPRRAVHFADMEVARLSNSLAGSGFEIKVSCPVQRCDLYLALQRAGELPQSGVDGFFDLEVDGVRSRHGSRAAWINLLAEPPPGWPRINAALVCRRLRDASGERAYSHARDARGCRHVNLHFSEETVREAFAELFALADQQCDQNGFFSKGGVRYARLKDWIKLLGKERPIPKDWRVAPNGCALGQRLARSPRCNGLTYEGVVVRAAFIAETDFRAAVTLTLARCELQVIEGTHGKEPYGTASAWANHFNEQPDLPNLTMELFTSTMYKAKSRWADFSEHVVSRGFAVAYSALYSHTLVMRVFADHIWLHRARAQDGISYFCPNREGVIERYGSLKYWRAFVHDKTGHLVASERKLSRQMIRAQPQALTYDVPLDGTNTRLWPQSALLGARDVREAVPPLASQCLWLECEDWRTLADWARLLDRAESALHKALQETDSVLRLVGGAVRQLYARSRVVECLRIPLAQEAGIDVPLTGKVGAFNNEQNEALCVWVCKAQEAEQALGRLILENQALARMAVTDHEWRSNHWRYARLAGKSLLRAPRARIQSIEASDRCSPAVAQQRGELLARAQRTIANLTAALGCSMQGGSATVTDCAGKGSAGKGSAGNGSSGNGFAKHGSANALGTITGGSEQEPQHSPALKAVVLPEIRRLLFHIERGNQARTYLNSGNGALVLYFVWQFRKRGGPHGVLAEHQGDMIDEAHMRLQAAIERFKPGSTRAGLATFALKCMFTALFELLLAVKWPDRPIYFRRLLHRFYKKLAQVTAEMGGTLGRDELRDQALQRLSSQDYKRHARKLRAALGSRQVADELVIELLSETDSGPENFCNGPGLTSTMFTTSPGSLDVLEDVRDAVSRLAPRPRKLIEGLFGFESNPVGPEVLMKKLQLSEAEFVEMRNAAIASLQSLLDK